MNCRHFWQHQFQLSQANRLITPNHGKGGKALAFPPFPFMVLAHEILKQVYSMTHKIVAALAVTASLLAACEQPSQVPKSGAAAMPTPTASNQSAQVPVETQVSTLSMINAKVRKPIDGRPTAGYLVIENGGTASERLTALTSSDFGRVELHDHVKDGEMMKMVKLDGLDIAPASQTTMEPGGKHLMLFDATRPLNNGDSIKITLTFSNSGPIETNFVVLNEIPRSTSADSMTVHDMTMPPK